MEQTPLHLACCFGCSSAVDEAPTHKVSAEAEVESMHALHVEGRPYFHIAFLQSQEPFLSALRQGLRQICEASLWNNLVETEELRSDVWRTCCRPMAVIWQLLLLRLREWPFELFALLNNRSERLARELLDERDCLKDAWTRHMMTLLDSPQKLISEPCTQLLSAMATLLQGSTYGTERLHSVNLRRSKTRVHSRRMSIAEIAKKHASFAAPPWLFPHVLQDPAQQKSGKKRGRPRKAEQEEGAPVPKKRRLGAGGAFRAFIHVKARSQQLNVELCAELAEYRQLTPDQKAYYIRLGEAGLGEAENEQHLPNGLCPSVLLGSLSGSGNPLRLGASDSDPSCQKVANRTRCNEASKILFAFVFRNVAYIFESVVKSDEALSLLQVIKAFVQCNF